MRLGILLNVEKMRQGLKIQAGGPGSGRKKEVEDYLQKQGFKLDQRYPHSDASPSFYTMRVGGGPNANAGYNHTVKVNPDGSWEHTSEAYHTGGDTAGLRGINFNPTRQPSLSASFSELKRVVKKIKAGGPGSGRHKDDWFDNDPGSYTDKFFKTKESEEKEAKPSRGALGDYGDRLKGGCKGANCGRKTKAPSGVHLPRRNKITKQEQDTLTSKALKVRVRKRARRKY